jgi:hypothetical protein
MPSHSLYRLDRGLSATPVTSSSRPEPRRLRARHHAGLVAGLIAVALAGAACGGARSGPGAAQSPATSTSRSSALQHLLQFSQCVRSHGVPDFPDPDSQGGFEPSQLTGIEGSPQLKAATAACKGDLPAGSPVPASEAEANLLKFAQCMRSHGEPDFPDPGSAAKPPPGAIDPTSPQFQRATKACQSLLAPSSSGSGGG